MSALFATTDTQRQGAPLSRLGLAFTGTAVVATLLFTAFAAVLAGAASGNAGSDPHSPTVLDYSDAHGDFALRVRIERPADPSSLFMRDTYSIASYDAHSRLLWSATDRHAQTFIIGGEVSRVVITRDDRIGPVTYWRRG